MSWRDKMQPTSFRGAGFYVRRHRARVGRRQVIHEFPLRELPYVEDLGRQARGFTIEAFVIGKDYMAARDALMAACEEAGAATLVHPYLGSMQATCEECSVEEGIEEQGLARLSLRFLEAGEARYPSQAQSYTDQASQAATGLQETSASVFSWIYQAVGPAWLAAAAAGDIKAALSLAKAVVTAIPSPFDQEAVGEFIEAVEAAAEVADVAVNGDPADLATLITETLTRLSELPAEGQAGAGVGAALELTHFGEAADSAEASIYGGTLGTIAQTTATRQTQAANRSALVGLVRELAVGEGVKAALAGEYSSYQEASTVRDAILDRIDVLMLDAGEDPSPDSDLRYEALRQLFASTRSAFVELGADLAREVPLQVGNGIKPSLVVAYDLYGDLSRTDEITARNGVRQPGALTPGATLQVLNA